MSGSRPLWRLGVALLAAAAIAVALFNLRAGLEGVSRTDVMVGGDTPATVYRAARSGAAPAPVVVIAHGFAGSRALMESFALTLARSGMIAVSFDFRGHGDNPVPLSGDVTKQDGATATLVDETAKVIGFARELEGADGRVALLGHSMASDIVVRAAVADPRIAATVAVSMFSRAVTATEPRNLLIIVGAWEGFLANEAIEAVRLATGGPADEAVTYGDPAGGTGRRAALADNVEHVGVLFSPESMAEARDWLTTVFGLPASQAAEVRGPWIGLLLSGIVAMGWPLAALLPRLAAPSAGFARAGRWRFMAEAAVPAVATPLILWPFDTGWLPVLVADYLAVHFALYGAIILGVIAVRRGLGGWPGAALGPLVLSIAAVSAWTVGVFGLALDAWVASFMPHAGRVWLIALLAVGTLAYLVADEWLTRGPDAPLGAKAISKIFMLLSLGAAVALNLEDLFFLIIILPVILLFFLLYGLFSGWVYRATGHPAVAGVANGLAFAWALGVTFPLLDG